MASNTIKTRIQLKNDTERNWNLATGFIPRKGEVIIYSAEQEGDELPSGRNELLPFSRLKVGDGSTSVTALPFLHAGIMQINSQNPDANGNFIFTAEDIGLNSPLNLVGELSTAAGAIGIVTDGYTPNIPTITGLNSYTPKIGDIVLDSVKGTEYICVEIATDFEQEPPVEVYKWKQLGEKAAAVYQQNITGGNSNDHDYPITVSPQIEAQDTTDKILKYNYLKFNPFQNNLIIGNNNGKINNYTIHSAISKDFADYNYEVFPIGLVYRGEVRDFSDTYGTYTNISAEPGSNGILAQHGDLVYLVPQELDDRQEGYYVFTEGETNTWEFLTPKSIGQSDKLITERLLYYYEGNSNISKLGTITQGVWNGTTISVADGGTNNTSVTPNGLLYGSSNNGQPQIKSAVPAWGSWINGTSSGPEAQIQLGNITYQNSPIPIANTEHSGVVNTGNQNFIGTKTFVGTQIKLQNNSTTTNISKFLFTSTELYDINNNYKLTDLGEWASFNVKLPAIKNDITHNTQISFRQFQITSSEDLETEGNPTIFSPGTNYEEYFLPAVSNGLTENKNYDIRTSKSSAYNVDTATHLSSAPNDSSKFYRGDKTWTNALTGGATFGGNVSITASDPSFWVQDNTKNVKVYLQATASTGGETGIYSEGYWNGSEKVTATKWMVARGQDGKVILYGKVEGDDAAQNPDGALLRSGAGRAGDSVTGDTWIFWDTLGGTTTPWGIRHGQAANTIDFIGSGTVGAYITLNNGNSKFGTISSGAITASSTIHADGGYLKSTLNGNTVQIGSQNANYCHIYNSVNIPFIFNKSVSSTDGDLGNATYPWHNLYIGKENGAGIYYQGTKASYRMIRFIDNTGDAYGNGIAIGGGGLTVLGSGESADTILSNLSLTSSGGTETTYIGSDGSIIFYPGINSWNAAAKIEMTAGRIFAGVNGDTTRENEVGVQSGAGQMYMYSAASTTGNRGLYFPAHGTGSAKSAIIADTNNNITFNGSLTGHASSDLALTGGTLTGNLTIQGTGSRYCRTLNTTTSAAVYLYSVDNGNHGIYSNGYWDGSTYTSSGKWLIYRNTSGTVIVSGNCTGSSGSCTGNAATCSYPYGFSSKTDNATWGNTTGTAIVSWNDSTGGSIAFRRDNPSSGKMSVKVDGRFYGNEGNNPAMLMTYANSYWGMGTADGATNDWIRTTSVGIIPYQSGGAGSGHCGLGTSSWYFSTAYIDNIYGKLHGSCTGSAGSVAWGNVTGKPTVPEIVASGRVSAKSVNVKIHNYISSTQTAFGFILLSNSWVAGPDNGSLYYITGIQKGSTYGFAHLGSTGTYGPTAVYYQNGNVTITFYNSDGGSYSLIRCYEA